MRRKELPELPEKEKEELLGETVPPSTLSGPHDRTEEMEGIKLEIENVKERIRQHSERRKKTVEGTKVETVPPDFRIKKSTRRKETGWKVKRKEIALVGENEEIRLQRKAMNRMFMSGKLKRGGVPPSRVSVKIQPTSACTRTASVSLNSMGRTVPPIIPQISWLKPRGEVLRGTIPSQKSQTRNQMPKETCTMLPGGGGGGRRYEEKCTSQVCVK